MSESFDSNKNNADGSFTFDTSLSAEFDLKMYAGIINELAVVAPKPAKKFLEQKFFHDSDHSDEDSATTDENQEDDLNQTHLTDEFSLMFSYFDRSIEQLNDCSDDELSKFSSEADVEGDNEWSEGDTLENDFHFHKGIKEDFLDDSDNESIVDDRSNQIDLHDSLTQELGPGNVSDKIRQYNRMLTKINEDISSEKLFFRKLVEENVSKETVSIERYIYPDNHYVSDFNVLTKYVKKLSSIESCSQIVGQLNHEVAVMSQLDEDRLDEFNSKSLKNFLHYVRVYSEECFSTSSAIRKDIAVDLDLNLVTYDDLMYCLDVVANEVQSPIRFSTPLI